jgi:hypothetical protein
MAGALFALDARFGDRRASTDTRIPTGIDGATAASGFDMGSLHKVK